VARVDEANFSGKSVTRVWLAASLREAEEIEGIFTDEDIDYFLELEPFISGTGMLPTSPAIGVSFYILAGQVSFCQHLLLQKGFKTSLVEDF